MSPVFKPMRNCISEVLLGTKNYQNFSRSNLEGILPTFNPLNKIVEPIVVCAMMTDT